MAKFHPIYKAGDKYANVRVLISNLTDQALYFNLRGIKDAWGKDLVPYGTQSSVLSTYQLYRAGALGDPNLTGAMTAGITDNPLTGLLKLAFYTMMGAYKAAKAEEAADAMNVAGNVTNYRAGLVPAKTNLFVELGSLPVDGTLNNKGWITIADGAGYTGSLLGTLPAGFTATEDEAAMEAAVRPNGLGLVGTGNSAGVGEMIFGGTAADVFVRLAPLASSAGYTVVDENDCTIAINTEFLYVVHTGGLDPGRLDFVNLVVMPSPPRVTGDMLKPEVPRSVEYKAVLLNDALKQQRSL